jgi:O-antigen ligase
MIDGTPPRDRLELVGLLALLAFVATLQLSIFTAQIMLTVVLLSWAGSLALSRERLRVPAIFWPLAAYAAASLVSAFFSMAPRASLVDSKQLLLFLVVPAVYHFARGGRADTVMDVIITIGAIAAIFGIVQYGVLEYNFLGMRPRGTMGHYMTYSGLLVLVIAAAAARLLFEKRNRVWPALVMPALLVALTVTFTRNAWIGATVAICVLLAMKDVRLFVAFPVLAVVLFFALASPQLADRFYSMFSRKDPAASDRLSMLRAGVNMVRDHPLAGVGPNAVPLVYPQYRPSDAIEPNQPHLHNVPLQIAAERGLPALALWGWFVVATGLGLWRLFRAHRGYLPAAGLAALAGMLTAGLFEYNFGDSEFLMLFLVIVTLPFAAAVDGQPSAPAVPSRAHRAAQGGAAGR